MTSRLPGRSDHFACPPWAFGLILAALAGAGLAITNPSAADFQAYAAERLVDEISEEVCTDGGLPLLMRLGIQNCEELVLAQRTPLAALVAGHTRRHNLGVLSLYRSDIGGHKLLGWRVPRFRSTVVGVAGQFVLIGAAIDKAVADPSQDAP
ncbi:DUF4359 domain-containing protein [Cyanobium sp. ATX 6E8]|uniref:DUF4359 domain-containing protein n=1 Tax=Cyanobium sp. ATX 6E8 TaxID=2823701 RepID=UPI0020CC207B|nr:DUF4359 domain-containing protein [Cyanobium sp. ATX 6E8]MCP9941656.1 DUF4359 domain-containing protein [Cyanobium sp. ATX 6E8]